MRFGVIIFPGSNCDRDCVYFLKEVLGCSVTAIWHKETALPPLDCVLLPGGFSYGDYLRCGAIARFSPIMKSVIDFVHSGGKVIGICNGFQILTESGLLPGALLRNRDLHFICREVSLKVCSSKNIWTRHLSVNRILRMPIAHMEGQYFNTAEGIDKLQQHDQIVLQYCNEDGEVSDSANPNGSRHNIAGISDRKGRVFGLMPHPERAGESLLGSEDGKLLFESIL